MESTTNFRENGDNLTIVNNDASGNNGGSGGEDNDDNSSHHNESTNNTTTDNVNNRNNMGTLSFRDVEDALDKFNGDPFEDIDQWLANFEEIGTTANWSETQKFVYARKLLTGTAKKSVKKTITTYDLLTAHLKKEYEDDATVMDVHLRLVNKKKVNKETYMSYMYDMDKINNGKMDDRAMVRYIADGISLDMRNKLTLLL